MTITRRLISNSLVGNCLSHAPRRPGTISRPMTKPTKASKTYTPTAAGIRVRQARIAAGFAEQVELGNASGVGALTINRVERGRGPLSRATAAKLAPILRRSEAWLLYGAEDGAQPGPEVPPAVEQYLTDQEWGGDVSPRVVKLLRGLDYSSVGVPEPTLKDVHRIREMIEINLSLARKPRG